MFKRMYFLIYCKYNYDHKWQLFTTLLSLQQLSCWTCFHTAVACENDQYLLQRFSHAAFKTHECHMTKTFTYYLLIPIASNGSGRDFFMHPPIRCYNTFVEYRHGECIVHNILTITFTMCSSYSCSLLLFT